MKIEFKSKNPIEIPLMDYSERRLRFALGSFSHRITKVTVRLEDLNGPKGGTDKRCRILVNIPTYDPVVVEDYDRDYETVVARAADRISHTLSRRLARERNWAVNDRRVER